MITNDHGLFLKNGRCLGHLMHFEGRGVYEPSDGLVDISPKAAKKHNDLLDQALIEGLDKRCKVGQSGMFYFFDKDGKRTVKTWTGKLVSDHVTKNGAVITFYRNNMTFRGRAQKDADCFNFKRVA